MRLNAGQFAAAQADSGTGLFRLSADGLCLPRCRPRARGVRALYTAILHDSLRYGEIYTSPGIEGVACWLPPGVPLPDLIP